MLADFRELPANVFRLFLGTDCYFFAPPKEIIAFVRNPDQPYKVLYAIDGSTFNKLYSLRYYSGNILNGLLGDCYCVAPEIFLERETIMSCLKLIDSWPPLGRWVPDLPGPKRVHACEQQAASILLAQFTARKLPHPRYSHFFMHPKTIFLHMRRPWDSGRSWKLTWGMPKRLISALEKIYKQLNYDNILEKMRGQKAEMATWRGRAKRLRWQLKL